MAALRYYLLLLLAITPITQADTSLRLHVSSFGAGAEIAYSFSPKRAIRIGALYGDFEIDVEGDNNNGVEGDELSYKSDIELRNGYLFHDWHPWGGWFRLSSGILVNNSKAKIITRCEENSPIPLFTNCEFGNSRFAPAVLGDIITNIDFEPINPYLGIGWSRATGKGWYVSADLGVAYLSDVNVDMRSTGSCNDNAQCRAEINEEKREVERELEELNLLPIALIAVNYRF